MTWLAALVVLAVILAALAVLRAIKESPDGTASWLVLILLGLSWVAMVLHDFFPRSNKLWSSLFTASCAAGAAACLYAFTRRVLWVTVPLLFFGTMLLFLWAARNGLPRLF